VELTPGYDPLKAAQVAAFFALKQGGEINVLKLAKLLYLTERESMARYDAPMFYDRLVSMDHGPVTSITLNLINGLLPHADWSSVIADRSGHMVGIGPDVSYGTLDRLSRADLRILDDLWERFGAWSQYELRDYTHQQCPEWEDPRGSSDPIPHERVFKFLDKKHPDALAKEVNDHRRLAALWLESV